MALFQDRPAKPRFVVVTKDYSGLGFAKLIKDGGYDVLIAYAPADDGKENPESFAVVGKNIVPRMSLDKFMTRREEWREAYILFDGNHWHEEGDILHEEGFKVWGGRTLQYNMEHDREFGVSIAKEAGLGIPESHEFASLEEGKAFLDANPDRAFVFKPNDQAEGWDTFVPDAERDAAANEELYTYMEALKDSKGGFILQEKKRGVEANFEIWVKDGVPFFAFADLECKKKLNDDYGCLVGGAQDIAFVIPLESKAIQETCIKLLTAEALKGYTGFLDINVIIAEKENYFLEFCARFGYPAHTTLMQTLAKSSFHDIMMDALDGNTEKFYDHFRYGFGAGITLYTDKPKMGMPCYVSDEADRFFYPYDTYMRDDLLLTAGLGSEVGVITGHGYTLKSSAEEAMKNRDRVNFPNRSARSDLGKNDYPSAPQSRYDALVAMKYI